jgi:hypothetical protein
MKHFNRSAHGYDRTVAASSHCIQILRFRRAGLGLTKTLDKRMGGAVDLHESLIWPEIIWGLVARYYLGLHAYQIAPNSRG